MSDKLKVTVGTIKLNKLEEQLIRIKQLIQDEWQDVSITKLKRELWKLRIKYLWI